ncbi:MAG: DUF5676 family membrane protein [Bacteroidota bacterium]
MKGPIQPYPVAIALSFIFLILYAVCIVLHFILPEAVWPMYRIWEMILPGFTWLTTTSLLLGILEMFIGGFLVAYTFIPLYNYLERRTSPVKGVQTMNKLRFKPVAGAVTIFGALSYVLCVVFDLIFPQWAMYQLWEILLPGFTWISWGSFFIGLVGIVVYGVYIAAVFVTVYNYFRGDDLPEIG